MTVKDLVSHMIPDDQININIIGSNESNEMEIVACSDDKIADYEKCNVVAWLFRHDTLQIIVKT